MPPNFPFFNFSIISLLSITLYGLILSWLIDIYFVRSDKREEEEFDKKFGKGAYKRHWEDIRRKAAE